MEKQEGGIKVFKFVKNDNLDTLLKKVKLNAIIMFCAYVVFIVIGIAGSLVMMEKDSSWVLFFIIIGLGALLFLPFLLFDYYSNKLSKYSVFTLSKEVDAMQVLNEQMKSCEILYDRLAISGEYIFSLKSTFYIPFAFPASDIEAVYFKRYGRRSSYGGNLFVIMKNAKLYKLPLGIKMTICMKQQIARNIMSYVAKHMTDVFAGLRSCVLSTRNVDKLKPFMFE